MEIEKIIVLFFIGIVIIAFAVFAIDVLTGIASIVTAIIGVMIPVVISVILGAIGIVMSLLGLIVLGIVKLIVYFKNKLRKDKK